MENAKGRNSLYPHQGCGGIANHASRSTGITGGNYCGNITQMNFVFENDHGNGSAN